ncbi:MAG: hypothetical protein CSA35_02885 [Dethiosulfovibrio peptidovorans]|nr:MAG: hypothetical protein CSA35_02885 [Dethiosulfovibrio peptidovorans]
MTRYQVDSLSFEFPDDWKVSKFDDWKFYRKHFSKMKNGIKALDLIALSPGRTLYLIEVKDYRFHRRKDDVPIQDVIINKVLGTLSALLPASLNANNFEEKKMAKKCLGAKKIRVIFHLEQPQNPSRLFPPVIDGARFYQVLKKSLRSIDPHPKIQSNKDPDAEPKFWK